MIHFRKWPSGWVFFLFFVSTSLAWGEDFNHFHSLGFSPDGKYFAFGETSALDKRGATFARLSVIEVESNQLVESQNFIADCRCEKLALESLVKNNPLNKKYKIIPYAHPGKVLVSRAPEDVSNYLTTSFLYSPRFPLSSEDPLKQDFFTLNLRQAEALPGQVRVCDDEEGSSVRLRVHLKRSQGNASDNLVLREDTLPPKNRGRCPHNYQIRYVIFHDAQMVIAISYSHQEEGEPNKRYLIASRSLPFWPLKAPETQRQVFR